MIDTRRQNNRWSHAPAVFIVARISGIIYTSYNQRESFITSLTAETALILNNQLHGDAFLVASGSNDNISSKLYQDKPKAEGFFKLC